MKQRKRDLQLQLQLPWRPLYEVMLALIADPLPRIDGEGRAARGIGGRWGSRGGLRVKRGPTHPTGPHLCDPPSLPPCPPAPAPHPLGIGLSSHRQATLFKLAAKARRFFGPAAVAEIWVEAEPALRAAGGGGACGRFEALAWLSLLLPTHDICK